jgi:hypothetical protein
MRVATGDMRLFLTEDFGRFDVVCAFCSLYYLPAADMVRMIAKAATMGATLILLPEIAHNREDDRPGHSAHVHDLRTAQAGDEVDQQNQRSHCRQHDTSCLYQMLLGPAHSRRSN